MKKYLMIPVALAMGLFISCDESDDTHKYTGDDVAYFAELSSTKTVNDSNPVLNVPFVTTVASPVDKTYNVTVTEIVNIYDPITGEITGTEEVPLSAGNSIALASATATVPAGSYLGNVVFNSDFDFATQGGQVFKITLTDGTGKVAVFNGANTYTLTVYKECVSDLAGQYSVTTTYGYHDFLPDYASNTMDATITQVSTGVYSVADFSGGLYSVGPYADEYGTGAADLTLTFTDTCGSISWTGQTDPYGPLLPNGVNSVDPDTGVVTLSWIATEYGETGVSVYTPIN